VSDLVQYTKDFGAFMHSASPAIPANVVADLVKTHVLALKAVVDAQAAKNWAQADSDFFTEGQTFTFSFVKPGTYPYFCKRHNSMRGEIKVLPSAP
jgi:plastocyanin